MAARRRRNSTAAKIGAKPAAGALTSSSSASSAAGCSRSAVRQAPSASSAESGSTAVRSAAANTAAGWASGVSLLIATRLTDAVLAARHLGQVAEQVRLAGAEPAGDAEAGAWRSAVPGIMQRLVERDLDQRMLVAHQPDRGAVGHAGPERLDGDARMDVHAPSQTSGATGFCPAPGRTSGQTRMRSAS